MNRFPAAAVAASLFVSLSSVAAQAQVREPVSVVVHHGDLDLHRADHRAMLDARIHRAAVLACGRMTRDLNDDGDISRCRKEMQADGAIQVAALSTTPVSLASNR